MDGGIHFLEILSLFWTNFSQHGVKFAFHLIVRYLRLRVSFYHLHLSPREFSELFLLFFPVFIESLYLGLGLFVNGLGLVVVELINVLFRFLLIQHNRIPILLFFLQIVDLAFQDSGLIYVPYFEHGRILFGPLLQEFLPDGLDFIFVLFSELLISGLDLLHNALSLVFVYFKLRYNTNYTFRSYYKCSFLAMLIF